MAQRKRGIPIIYLLLAAIGIAVLVWFLLTRADRGADVGLVPGDGGGGGAVSLALEAVQEPPGLAA